MQSITDDVMSTACEAMLSGLLLTVLTVLHRLKNCCYDVRVIPYLST